MSMTSMNLSTAVSPSGAATGALAVRDPWAMVPSLGNLDAYISAVNRIPLLTQDEETSLGRRLRADGDLAAAGQLVLSHLRLVVSISRQYLGYGLPQGDLIQEGNVGLMKAVKRFDPEQGVRLVSYAMHWIKATTSESSGSTSPLPAGRGCCVPGRPGPSPAVGASWRRGPCCSAPAWPG